MFVIGLTGGIGTGKSEVSRLLGELGAEVIEADRVAHEAYEPGTPGWREVVSAFGKGVLDADGTEPHARFGRVDIHRERGHPGRFLRSAAASEPDRQQGRRDTSRHHRPPIESSHSPPLGCLVQ